MFDIHRLPAISKGKVKNVNFNDFLIDKESIGPIIESLSNINCSLKNINLSISSIKSLDYQSSNMLGQFLKKQRINVKISQSIDTQQMMEMFKILDENKNGYLELNEFTVGFNALKYNIKQDEYGMYLCV